MVYLNTEVAFKAACTNPSLEPYLQYFIAVFFKYVEQGLTKGYGWIATNALWTAPYFQLSVIFGFSGHSAFETYFVIEKSFFFFEKVVSGKAHSDFVERLDFEDVGRSF